MSASPGSRRVGLAAVAAACAVLPASLGGRAAAAPADRGEHLGVPACATQELRIAVAPLSGGLDHAGRVLRFTNTGDECGMEGYPRVVASTAGGRRVTARDTKQGYLGGMSGTAPLVALTGHRAGSALLEGLLGTATGTCPTYTRLTITPPESHTARTLRVHLTLCDLQVHPVVYGPTGRD